MKLGLKILQNGELVLPRFMAISTTSLGETQLISPIFRDRVIHCQYFLIERVPFYSSSLYQIHNFPF